MDIATVVSLYQKVNAVPIFALKAYLEYTNGMSITTFWKLLTNLVVNFLFMLLDLVVSLFYLLLKFFDQFDLYNTYKNVVYNTSKGLWLGLTGSGNYTDSMLYLGLAFVSVTIFLGHLFSKGDVGKRLLHLFAVILLALTYFGTTKETSGGLFILDTVHQVGNKIGNKIATTTITDPENDKQTIGTTSVADNYVARTAYAAYLYVNTGRLDGKYTNKQTGKEEVFDDAKVLGKMVDGKFVEADSAERDKKGGYLDEMGDGALESQEKNSWVSATFDYFFAKLFYVFFKIVEAFVLGVPLLLIKLMTFTSQLLVFVLMIGVPLALLMSLTPRTQNILYNLFKLLIGSSLFPVLTGFLILLVFYIEALINEFVQSGFEALAKGVSMNFGVYQPILELATVTFVQVIVFLMIWRNKFSLLSKLMGQNQAREISKLSETTVGATQAINDGVLYGAGAMTGLAISAKDGLGRVMTGGVDYIGVNPMSTAPDNSPSAPTDTSDGELPPYDGTVAPPLSDMSESELLSYDDTVVPPMSDIPDSELPSYDDTLVPPLSDIADSELLSYDDTVVPPMSDIPDSEFSSYDDMAIQPLSEPAESDLSSASPDLAIEESPSQTALSPSLFKQVHRRKGQEYRVHSLEQELRRQQSNLSSSPKTSQNPFKRGLSKTMTHHSHYQMTQKKIDKIEKKLARLRGE